MAKRAARIRVEPTRYADGTLLGWYVTLVTSIANWNLAPLWKALPKRKAMQLACAVSEETGISIELVPLKRKKRTRLGT